MKSQKTLEENVRALLKARQQSQRDLASWCHRSESWLSNIFTKPERGLPLKYLDRIADFFGIAPYQLFQPGISPLTERRSGQDRRSGRDRRIGRAPLMLTGAALAQSLTADEIHLLRRVRQLKVEHWQHVSRWIDATLLAQGIAPETAPPPGQRKIDGGARSPAKRNRGE